MAMLDRLTERRSHQVAKVLQGYLDGEVDPATAHMVHEHLEVCRRCGPEASTYRAIKTASPMAHATPVPLEVDPQAVERLRRSPTSCHGRPTPPRSEGCTNRVSQRRAGISAASW